jgi:asparagine synthase (glutamine-hydrolysing)
MCGIAGIYAYGTDTPPVNRDELVAIREAMLRRGPDGAGLWIASHARAGLAHRRLAIIDLSDAAAQPMPGADGRLHITFNGEIYNWRALRAGLERRGHRFRTQSDTEVLLALYLEHGAYMVRELRGMFALGIWDERERSLFLARDPFGIKPLYYSDGAGTFRFASQVKALLAGRAIDPAPDPAGHAGFFLWGSVPEPLTTYRAIRMLPAGCTLLVTARGVQAPARYFSMRDEMLRAEEAAPPKEAGELVAHALRDSVKHHLVSDVPVGLFLSAGIDSSALAGIASESVSGRLRTITLGFPEDPRNDETTWASRTAALYETEHETRWIEKSDFEQHVEEILAAMDQPSIDGVNTWFVSRAAASAGLKVAMSGLGGDELFGGYPSFRDVPRMARLPRLGRGVRRLASALSPRSVSPKYAGLFELGGTTAGAYLLRRGLYMPWELPNVMDAEMAARGLDELQCLPAVEDTVRGLRSARLRVSALELSWYMRNQLLRDADWAGMAHSLEIRVPLVDVAFFRAVLPLLASPNPPGKSALAAAPARALPRELVERAKSGFTVPVSDWIREGVAGRSRGLRGWARRVDSAPGVGHRILALLTDGLGGRGGIALYVRDLLSAMASHRGVRQIIALPRLAAERQVVDTPKIVERTDGIGGKLAFVAAVTRALRAAPDVDLIICGHVNLAPLAALAKWWTGARVMLCTYGVEAWQPPGSRAARASLAQCDDFLSISEVTRSRFVEWSRHPSPGHVIPNAIHLDWYGPGPKNAALVARYALEGRTVLMTLGRLAAAERYKGFDAVIEAMPRLLERFPRLVYLVAGEGDDRPRLEAKARSMGLGERVVFTGYVEESAKADHYRLADAYVMPSHGEGFGFVLLEALACGIPALASRLDGGREALRNGLLGVLVDPRDPEDLCRGIAATLETPRGAVPGELAYFSYPKFEQRAHNLLDKTLYGQSVTASAADERLEARAR